MRACASSPTLTITCSSYCMTSAAKRWASRCVRENGINKMLATNWGLFDEYEDAEAALAELNRLEVPAEARNAILQESVAKNRSPVDLNKVGVAAAGQFGDRLLSGLDRLVLNQRPVPLT